MKLIFFFLGFSLYGQAYAQRIDSFKTHISNSFRGLSVPNDNTIWVSGTKGTVGRSTDGGHTWNFISVPNMQNADFRDIEAFDENNAIVLSISSPGYLLKTTDGGKSWKTIYTDTAKDVFFDAMSFNKKRKGILTGDPVNGKPYFLSIDFNKEEVKQISVPAALEPGEAFFAASGTNIQFIQPNDDDFVFVTGGKRSRLGNDDGEMIELPIIQNKESTGANSVAVWSKKVFAVAGGDFADDKNASDNFCFTNDGGKHFIRAHEPPHGYRSCVIYTDKKTLIACGTSGVDISTDGGINWHLISEAGYHSVQKSKSGNKVYLSGPKGRIAVLRNE